MSDVFTSREDENTIAEIIRYGLTGSCHKWMVLRIALARSMRLSELPDDSFDKANIREKGSEYRLQQVTGSGHAPDERGPRDFNDAVCAMLSVLHHEDLFADEEAYRRYLQRHIRRGLAELRTSWSRKNDFYDYLYQEFFAAYEQSYGDTPAIENETLVHALRKAIGLNAELVNITTGYRLQRFTLKFSQAGDFELLRKGLDKLCFQLGLSEGSLTVMQANEPLTAWLDQPLPKAQWKSVRADDLKDWIDQADETTPPMSMWLGVDVLGEPFCFDLDEAPHVLVAGTTGSGKSVCVHAMLMSLLWRLSPRQMQLCMIDPKRMEFGHYAGLPHLFGQDIVTEMDDVADVLKALVEEMEERSRIFSDYDYASFSDVWLARDTVAARMRADQFAERDIETHLSYLVVCIDELADLIMQLPEAEHQLVRLAQKGRAMGIRLILATQRPDAKTFTGKLRSNIPARIALAVQTSVESRIILDDTGAEHLLKPGDMLVKPTAGADAVRVHGVNVRTNDIAACVSDGMRQPSWSETQ